MLWRLQHAGEPQPSCCNPPTHVTFMACGAAKHHCIVISMGFEANFATLRPERVCSPAPGQASLVTPRVGDVLPDGEIRLFQRSHLIHPCLCPSAISVTGAVQLLSCHLQCAQSFGASAKTPLQRSQRHTRLVKPEDVTLLIAGRTGQPACR